jgi:hypothetical protein
VQLLARALRWARSTRCSRSTDWRFRLSQKYPSACVFLHDHRALLLTHAPQACFSGSDHGSGRTAQILAASAVSCQIVTTSGDVMIAVKHGENAEIFAAAAAGLGLCGLVLEVTFACEPAFRLAVRMEKIRLEDVLHDGPGGLQDMAGRADMVKVLV